MGLESDHHRSKKVFYAPSITCAQTNQNGCSVLEYRSQETVAEGTDLH